MEERETEHTSLWPSQVCVVSLPLVGLTLAWPLLLQLCLELWYSLGYASYKREKTCVLKRCVCQCVIILTLPNKLVGQCVRRLFLLPGSTPIKWLLKLINFALKVHQIDASVNTVQHFLFPDPSWLYASIKFMTAPSVSSSWGRACTLDVH